MMESFTKEVWKDSLEFPENYEVSNLGKVRNKRGHILAQEHHKTNCYRVRLCVSRVKYSRSVHRMVAEAFIPNPENKPEVNHIDGNRLNNMLENLEWNTRKENMEHATREGLISNPFGKEARNSKFVTKVFDMGGNLVAKCYGNQDLKDLGFDWRNVHAVLKGKQKTHRGHKFSREEK
ncbi:HNH endonuclease [Alteromonas phage vB_AmeM_PT11-V22]|uniref:HNH homing endonuclease n=1 Tax=Alteromonas phage vB_AmeM_PT11-V22 TaxID=2704031 RepID=A0A6C0R0L2_9CAUD|nr:HNH endonuclease [Alteromonas phage vB_AmeM_PT11-V22]QHZ59760.1 HNH homing endonuclease [Alteromonas phage vB_AmeM_PT11-V22]